MSRGLSRGHITYRRHGIFLLRRTKYERAGETNGGKTFSLTPVIVTHGTLLFDAA
jgi:hypothetical protein